MMIEPGETVTLHLDHTFSGQAFDCFTPASRPLGSFQRASLAKVASEWSLVLTASLQVAADERVTIYLKGSVVTLPSVLPLNNPYPHALFVSTNAIAGFIERLPVLVSDAVGTFNKSELRLTSPMVTKTPSPTPVPSFHNVTHNSSGAEVASAKVDDTPNYASGEIVALEFTLFPGMSIFAGEEITLDLEGFFGPEDGIMMTTLSIGKRGEMTPCPKLDAPKNQFFYRLVTESSPLEKEYNNIDIYHKIDTNYVVCRAFKKLSEVLRISRETIQKPHKLIVMLGKSAQDEINKASKDSFFKYKLFSSITQSESKILLVDVKK